jgi:hypothetical protein
VIFALLDPCALLDLHSLPLIAHPIEGVIFYGHNTRSSTCRSCFHSVWVPPPDAERAGPTPLQLIWTIVMVAFLATFFIYIVINLV